MMNVEMDGVAQRVSLLLSEPDIPSSSSAYSSDADEEGHWSYNYNPDDDASLNSSQDDSDDWLTLDLHFLETAARTAKLDSRKAQLVLGLITDGDKPVRDWRYGDRGRMGRGVWTPVRSVKSSGSRRGGRARSEERPLLKGKEWEHLERDTQLKKREESTYGERQGRIAGEGVKRMSIVGLAKPVSFAAHRHSVSLVDNPAPSRRPSISQTPAPLFVAKSRPSLDRDRGQLSSASTQPRTTPSRVGGRDSAMGFVNFSRPLSVSMGSPAVAVTNTPGGESQEKETQKEGETTSIPLLTPSSLPIPSTSTTITKSPFPSPLSIRIPPPEPHRVVREDIGLPRTPSHHTLAVARPIFQRVDSRRGRTTPVSGKSDITYHPYQRHKRARKGSIWSSLPVCGLDGLVARVGRGADRGKHMRLRDEKEKQKGRNVKRMHSHRSSVEASRLRKPRTPNRSVGLGGNARRTKSASAVSRVRLTEDNLRKFEGRVGSVPRPIDRSVLPTAWKTGDDGLKLAQVTLSGRLVDKRLPTPPKTGPRTPCHNTHDPTNKREHKTSLSTPPSPPPKEPLTPPSTHTPTVSIQVLHPPLIPRRHNQSQTSLQDPFTTNPFYRHANTAVFAPRSTTATTSSLHLPLQPVPSHSISDRDLEMSLCVICHEDKFVSAFPVRQSTSRCRHAPHVCWNCVEWGVRSGVEALRRGDAGGICCLECRERMGREDVRVFAEGGIWEEYLALIG
ncbi:hypothetical protein B0J11DRAFT_606622 [Dendryphion nanum]|uniref:Uncharacterized protein n=1 Tax=Dendryphion nanum TaxID=256645 RepID=A0A9P9ILG4_9PLEO|nr:hypothetical protein B0J11DRAFT_606622 [Dendryphion nanum]